MCLKKCTKNGAQRETNENYPSHTGHKLVCKVSRTGDTYQLEIYINYLTNVGLKPECKGSSVVENPE